MIWGAGSAPNGMSTPTAAAGSAPSTSRASSTLGARLAAASRQAQGLAQAVDDPTALSELRELCSAPRSTRQAAPGTREGPAP